MIFPKAPKGSAFTVYQWGVIQRDAGGGRRKDFFQGGANRGFSKGSQKDIRRGAKSGKILF